MLSPLQRRLRRIIDTIPEAADVALAGGGALIVRGVVARPTADLDYFATSSRDVDRLLPALEARLEGEGLRTRRVQNHPGFARLSVSDGHDTARVDLAWDTRMWPPEKTAGGVLLSEQELGADKLLALADRGEARDYIDVAALADGSVFRACTSWRKGSIRSCIPDSCCPRWRYSTASQEQTSV